MNFSDISTKANGNKFFYNWFNDLRDAGLALQNFLGAGYITETQFTIQNQQIIAANVTGLVLSAASYTAGIAQVVIRRKTASVNEVVSIGLLKLIYRSDLATWELIEELSGDDTGVTLTITPAGQVQYASTLISGASYVGTMKFKLMSFAA